MKLGSNSVVFAILWLARPSYAHWKYIGLITDSGTSSAAVSTAREKEPVPFDSVGAICNVNIEYPATETVPVAAGSKVGFKLDVGVIHEGPAAMYIGQPPAGTTLEQSDGTGFAWAKIEEWGAKSFNPLKFEPFGKNTFMATIPTTIPAGEYLLRMENIALHRAHQPELFVGCARIKVTGGGTTMPPTVSIPGWISLDDPAIQLDIFYPPPQSYTVPGPRPIYESAPGGTSDGSSPNTVTTAASVPAGVPTGSGTTVGAPADAPPAATENPPVPPQVDNNSPSANLPSQNNPPSTNPDTQTTSPGTPAANPATNPATNPAPGTNYGAAPVSGQGQSSSASGPDGHQGPPGGRYGRNRQVVSGQGSGVQGAENPKSSCRGSNIQKRSNTYVARRHAHLKSRMLHGRSS